MIAGAGAIVCGELVLAAALATGRLTNVLLALGAGLALALMAAFPLAAATAVLVATASVFHGDWFNVGMGPVTTAPYEMLLVGLLLVAVVRPRRSTWGGTAGAALAVFLLLLVVSEALAVSAGRVDASTAFQWSRGFLFFTFFYVVVRLFPEADQRRRLLAAVCAVGALTGVVALAISLGSGLGDVLQDRTGQFVRSQEGLGIIERVRLPGVSLAYAVFWYAAVRAFTVRGVARTWWMAAVAGLLINIAVSFNRNMWLGLVVGLVVVVAFGGTMVRRQVSVALAVLACAGAGLALVGANLEQRSTLTPLLQRGESLFDPQSLTAESSLRARANENERAWAEVRRNPLLGVGAGVEFGIFFNEATPSGNFVRKPQLFLHNQYLYLALIAGFPALVAFLIFLASVSRQAWRSGRRSPSVAACAAGVVMIAVSAVVAIYFTAEDMVLALTLLAGYVVAEGSE